LPALTLSNLGEYDAWKESNISSMPIVVTADFIWAEGEGHFAAHRYRITSYQYDEQGGTYSQRDQYVTDKAYDDNVLQQERATIFVRLKNGAFQTPTTSTTGDSLSRTLHPPVRPLPGLPDLNRAVFLSAGSVVCENANLVFGTQRELNKALKNAAYVQGATMLMKANHCTVADHDVRVSILISTTTDSRALMIDKTYQTVAIEWINSDGSTDEAWTLVTSLHN
jgi:hypothetical protein